MKRKSSILSLVLAIVMIFGVLSGCGNTNQVQSTIPSSSSSESATATPESTVPSYLNDAAAFPIVKEPITLKAMVLLSPAQPAEWNDILVWQEYEKMTGIHIEWEAYSSADIVEKRNLALASDSMPDMFFRTKLPDNDIAKYGAEGSFIKLNDLIDQYAPNFKAVMEKYPDVKKGIPMADGTIYALPNLTDSPSIEIYRKLFVNQKWLKEVGMPSPTSIDELYDVLKAFRTKDPNKNGKQDEIPLTADNIPELLQIFIGAFGLGNQGTGNGNWDLDPASGDLRFYPASQGYKDLLTFINKLYSEKLLEQEIFTTNAKDILAKNEQELIGSFSFANVFARANSNATDFAGLDTALAGPSGERVYTSARGHVGSRGAFVITKANKYPEATMRWVDYFYSEEGTKMLYLGKEGVSYGKKADGSYDFLPEIVNNIPEGSSFDQVVSKYVPYAGGALPTIIYEDFFKGGETQPVPKAAAQALAPYLPKELWAPFSFTSDESERKVVLETDITGLVNQRTAEFIQGKVSLSEFDNYVKQLEQMGLSELKKIYNSAYTRYKSNK